MSRETNETATGTPETDEHIPDSVLDSISLVLESLAAWERDEPEKTQARPDADE